MHKQQTINLHKQRTITNKHNSDQGQNKNFTPIIVSKAHFCIIVGYREYLCKSKLYLLSSIEEVRIQFFWCYSYIEKE